MWSLRYIYLGQNSYGDDGGDVYDEDVSDDACDDICDDKDYLSL